MATMVTPQTESFKRNVADLYGDRTATPSLATDRQLYRETVASVASRAKAAMPEALHGRIDAGQKLVLAGDVELLPDGRAQVASQSNGATSYYVVNGECSCKDFPKALDGWCKHRLGAAIHKRVRQALAIADVQRAAPQDNAPPQDDAQPTPTPVEPPAGELTHDMQLLTPYITLIHGKKFVQYAGLLALAHARGLRELAATITTHIDGTLAIAEATALFADGRRFTESGDASPSNVSVAVKVHFIRCALTRAKSRCLRDALGIDMCSVEELEG
jgi:hypothetical protein